MSSRDDGYAPGRARRELILNEAVAAFGASGFENATLTDIATACGVSRQGLLHHFSSKEELLTAVLARRDELDGERFTTAISSNRTPTEAIVDVVTDNALSPNVMRLYTVLSAEATNPEHAAHAYFVSLYDRLRNQLTEAIRDAQSAGAVPDSWSAETFAAVLLALKDGLALQALLSPDAVEPAKIIREVNAMLLSGVTSPDGSSEAAPEATADAARQPSDQPTRSL